MKRFMAFVLQVLLAAGTILLIALGLAALAGCPGSPQHGPDDNIAPLGTCMVMYIPRAADDPIWEGLPPDTDSIWIEEGYCASFGVTHPAKLVKVYDGWQRQLGVTEKLEEE